MFFSFIFLHLVAHCLTAAGERGIAPSQAFGHAKKPLPGQILVFFIAAGANDGRALPVTVITSPVKQQRKAGRFYRITESVSDGVGSGSIWVITSGK
jgi:hypothetical protein